MSEQSGETIEVGNERHSARSADAAPNPQNPPGAATVPPEKQKGARRRKMLLGALGILVLAGALWFGIPWVQTTLNTVSTDDAYVNGHVTFVAARVKGQSRASLSTTTTACARASFWSNSTRSPFRSRSR
jgi:membrane fusion protein, multidrug efflux system